MWLGRQSPKTHVDMWIACDYTKRMPVMVQIRNVPDELHRKMKSRAALAGMSLSEYLLNVMRMAAERPTVEEFEARLATRAPVMTTEAPVDIIRAWRDASELDRS
jgi:plasmid stability protein